MMRSKGGFISLWHVFIFNVCALEAIICVCDKCLYFLGERNELWEIKGSVGGVSKKGLRWPSSQVPQLFLRDTGVRDLDSFPSKVFRLALNWQTH